MGGSTTASGQATPRGEAGGLSRQSSAADFTNAPSGGEPGGGGEPYDWGEASVADMLEKLAHDPLLLKSRGAIHSERTAVEKHMANQAVTECCPNLCPKQG